MRNPYPLIKRQRGAMGIFAALTMLLAFMFAALAVDSGRLWNDKRELQSIADIAAIEAASASQGCGSGDAGGMVDAAQTAAARNGFNVGNGYSGNVNDGTNSVALGGISIVDNKRVFGAGAGAEAVRVNLSRTVPASLLLGGLFGGTTTMTATATARISPAQAAISVGSALLRIDTTSNDASLLNLLFGKILGGSLTLDAVSYKGLANTDVSLLGLAHAHAAAGTVDELLNANMTVGDLLGLTANAINSEGTGSATTTLAMNKLIAANLHNQNITLGDVLKVTTPDSEAAGKVRVNVMDLITASLMLADKNHAIALGVAIPNLAAVHVTVIEPPQIAIGPAGKDSNGNWCTQATTAQIRVAADVKTNLGLLGLASVTADLSLGVQVAPGEAHLVSISRQSGASDVAVGASPGLIKLALTKVGGDPITGIPPGNVTVKLLVPLLSVDLGLNLPFVTPPSDFTFTVDYPIADSLPQKHSIASSLGGSLHDGLSQSNAITTDIQVLGLGVDLSSLLDPLLNNILAPLLGSIGSQVLDPLLKLVGIQTGVVDVQLLDLQTTGTQLLI